MFKSSRINHAQSILISLPLSLISIHVITTLSQCILDLGSFSFLFFISISLPRLSLIYISLPLS